MRNKIIAVNALIVLIVGLFSWVLVRGAIGSASDDGATLASDAKHAAFGASAKLQLDAMRAELWLSTSAAVYLTSEWQLRPAFALRQPVGAFSTSVTTASPASSCRRIAESTAARS